IIGFGIIISLPVLFLSISFSSYYSIEHHKEYYYYNNSINSDMIKTLNLNSDVGEMEVNYIYTPVDYCVKVELNIELMSQKHQGDSYLDYFEIPSWQNTSSSIKFIMSLKPDVLDTWFNVSLWKEQEVSVIATINANFIFNINTTINYVGDVDILVPAGIYINNIDVNINQGNIYYDFFYSTIEGNVTGSVVFGDITLKGNNVRYTKNSILSLINDDGLITFNIIQQRAMGTNLTGIGITKMGQIKIQYQDYSEYIGAMFTFYNYSAFWPDYYNPRVGFSGPESFNTSDFGYIFTSFDFPTKNNYNFSLYRDFIYRPLPYTVDLFSIPKT
ncbi:MAG: hypothetical protein ACFFDH_12950, partial [Promethearchaeota archaeon]